MIHVLIADDHKIMIDGLKVLLEKAPDIKVVGEATNGIQVLDALDRGGVDIIILDIEMPGLDGVDVTREVIKRFPDVKILVLSMYKKEEFIVGLVRMGVDGYVLKENGRDELVKAVRKISEGKKYYDEKVTETIIESMSKPQKAHPAETLRLTRREKEVLELIADGLTTPKMAERLHIANSTVETHRRNLIEKTGVANSKELIRFAVENGFTSSGHR